MKRATIFLALIASVVTPVSLAAQAPTCDVTCTPNMGSPSYGGAAAAAQSCSMPEGPRVPPLQK
jgi:hypothetical protein